MMLVGTGLTICPACGRVVPVVLGFCVLCAETLPDATLAREVVKADELLEAA